jgi:hypothetical protein
MTENTGQSRRLLTPIYQRYVDVGTKDPRSLGAP